MELFTHIDLNHAVRPSTKKNLSVNVFYGNFFQSFQSQICSFKPQAPTTDLKWCPCLITFHSSTVGTLNSTNDSLKYWIILTYIFFFVRIFCKLVVNNNHNNNMSVLYCMHNELFINQSIHFGNCGGSTEWYSTEQHEWRLSHGAATVRAMYCMCTKDI